MTYKKFGSIGGGVMAEALLSRLIFQKIYSARDVLVGEPSPGRRDFWREKYGVEVTGDNKEVLAEVSEAILLAVKPQVFPAVAAELGDFDLAGDRKPLVISILAGVPLSKLEAAFGDWPVVRVMPNTPATVGAGISAIAPGKYVTPSCMEVAKGVLQAVGDVVEVPESMMDAVTGLSGSGPGYVAVFIEALSDGGVRAGLPRAIAYQLALQTVLGTAVLLQESGMHPAVLKDKVTSPGGTTMAGIAELESSAFRSASIEAVVAARDRSRELGGG